MCHGRLASCALFYSEPQVLHYDGGDRGAGYRPAVTEHESEGEGRSPLTRSKSRQAIKSMNRTTIPSSRRSRATRHRRSSVYSDSLPPMRHMVGLVGWNQDREAGSAQRARRTRAPGIIRAAPELYRPPAPGFEPPGFERLNGDDPASAGAAGGDASDLPRNRRFPLEERRQRTLRLPCSLNPLRWQRRQPATNHSGRT